MMHCLGCEPMTQYMYVVVNMMEYFNKWNDSFCIQISALVGWTIGEGNVTT